MVSLFSSVIIERPLLPPYSEGGVSLSAAAEGWYTLSRQGDKQAGAVGVRDPIRAAIGSRFPSPLPGR